ncbi:MAG: hypothetical protein AAFO69_20850, partial [Bacteroidota bacterium]
MNIKELNQTKPTSAGFTASADKEPVESIWNKEISLGGNKIPDKEKFGLYHQLHNLIDAGMDIRYAF